MPPFVKWEVRWFHDHYPLTFALGLLTLEIDTTKIVVEMDKLEMDKLGDCAMGETLAVETPAPSRVLEGGTFHTQLVRHPNVQYRLHDHMFIKYATEFSDPPAIVLAINSLEVDRCANVRVRATAEDIHEHIFGAHIRSWGDTRLYSAGCTWLAVPRGHPDFQTGTFSTGEDHVWSKPQHLTHRKVVFDHAYQAPPKVVVWLNKLDLSRDHNERVMAFATDITATGFTVHINSWGDTKLHGAAISWFAYPAGFPGICSGDMLPQKGTSGVVKFERKFAKPPTVVLVGLNKLESDRSGRCSFNISIDAVSEIGMGIRVEGWSDTVLHSAGVAYLAIE